MIGIIIIIIIVVLWVELTTVGLQTAQFCVCFGIRKAMPVLAYAVQTFLLHLPHIQMSSTLSVKQIFCKHLQVYYLAPGQRFVHA